MSGLASSLPEDSTQNNKSKQQLGQEEKVLIAKDRESLRESIKSKEENKDAKIGDIVYCGNFNLIPDMDGKYAFNTDVFIVSKQENGLSTYEIYDRNQDLIATVDSNMRLQFTETRN